MGDAEGKVPPALVPKASGTLRQEILAARRPELYRCLLDPAGPKPIYSPGKGPAALPTGANLALKKPCVFEPQPNYKGVDRNRLYGRAHDPGDATDLTDGKLAAGCLGDARWVVWTRQAKWAVEPPPNLGDLRQASVTVDLGEVKPVGRVAAHLWSAPGWGAPFPTMALELSDDGKKFAQAASTSAAAQGYLEPSGWPRVDWFVLPVARHRARFVKLIFGFARGGVHLAADEVAVYAE